MLRQSFDSSSRAHFLGAVPQLVHRRPNCFDSLPTGTPNILCIVKRIFCRAVVVVRFLVKFIDAKNDVDVTVVCRNKDELAILVTTARLEINAIFASYIVSDDKVTQACGVGSVQGPCKADVNVAISEGKSSDESVATTGVG